MAARWFAGGLAVVIVGAIVVGIVQCWSAEEWSALAAGITAAVALVAGVVGLGQLHEARQARVEQVRLRKEQAQPYVVAYIEFSEASTYVVDLVVKNFGATAARDIELIIDPWPRRSIDEDQSSAEGGQPPGAGSATETDQGDPEASEAVWLPERIPVLVPGQEWRTLWDTGRRVETDLPDFHTAKISCLDSQGERHEVETVLDWRFLKHRDVVTVYGRHEMAKALRDMSKTVAGWREGASGLSVYARDGDAKDKRAQERREARLKAQQDDQDEGR